MIRTLDRARPVPQIGRSRTPTRAAAPVVDGDVAKALKELKREAADSGHFALLNRRSTHWFHLSAGAARRRKSAKARARARKLATKTALRDRDPREINAVSHRREVISRPAA